MIAAIRQPQAAAAVPELDGSQYGLDDTVYRWHH